MGRYQLEYKVQRNGNSLKYYEHGEYLGSISLKRLGQLIRREKLTNPEQETTQNGAS